MAVTNPGAIFLILGLFASVGLDMDVDGSSSLKIISSVLAGVVIMILGLISLLDGT